MRFIPNTTILKVTLAAALSLALTTSALAFGGALTGELKVKNDRHRAVTVYIDGQRATPLAPGQKRVFKRVPNGIRLVTVVGPRGHQLNERVQVDIDRRSRLRIAPRLGTAIIDNRSGFDMRVTVDGRDLGIIRHDQRHLTNPMRPGSYVLTAYPLKVHNAAHAQRVPLTKRFNVTAGQQRRVRLQDYAASLEITNPFPHRVRVHVDGARVGRLKAGERMVLDGQLPGLVRVSLARYGRTLADASVKLRPGQAAAWAPHYANTGDLRIRNAAPVALRVKVNGTRYGKLAPGQVKVIRDIPAGLVTVSGRTTRGRHFEKTVHVVADELARVRLSGNMPVSQASYGGGY